MNMNIFTDWIISSVQSVECFSSSERSEEFVSMNFDKILTNFIARLVPYKT